MDLNKALGEELLSAVHSRSPVSGATHEFYRYPARFSPIFARAVIKAFSKPGQIVLDPFMGCGTTLVEASILGRIGIGTDISSLATFISHVKTTPLSEKELFQIRKWAESLAPSLNLRNLPERANEWLNRGYQMNISDKRTWPIRKTIELALARVTELPSARQQRFVRCVFLKTSQWALDCKKFVPSAKQFRQQFYLYLNRMLNAVEDYTHLVHAADMSHSYRDLPRTLIINRSAIGIDKEPKLQNTPSPALILTSPPYPGVHILYHRWQVQGRRETAAPFWIINSLDGQGESFYTFGHRKQPGLKRYFSQLLSAFCSIAKIADKKTLVVQMVSFPEPLWQLPKYLNMIREAGLLEIKFPSFCNSPDGRMWRSIPNRKWYVSSSKDTATSKEVVLFHRLA